MGKSAMKRMTGLSWEIAVTMVVMSVFIVISVFVGSICFYYFLWNNDPASLSSMDVFFPSKSEWAWYFSNTLLASLLTLTVACRLSRRILEPLNSVAACVRRIADGDLTARAATGNAALGETAQLVRDFNVMAERLERMSQEQAQWNAAISHELRTPVSILRGRLQGLVEGVFPPSTLLFSSLLSQVESLGRLIEDLRTVALADNARLKLKLELVDIGDEVQVLMGAVNHSFKAKGFSIQHDLKSVMVVCDSIRIKQALVALMDNVIKHAEPGPVWIRVRADDDAKVASLIVEDSGPGVHDFLLDNKFLAFRKGASSKNGMGLGLSVVQAIVNAHNGSIRCFNNEYGGAVFEIKLPL